ncbi:unnamed protein product [Paramecium sonneborni]|uniref:RAP domain-containing protein n=1 Tax=Paramecium sonneborni TaxID=65129 RepID=A0A8S1LUL5_9CILI|nr:unnamed protein product [Paramecium sonneborni]
MLKFLFTSKLSFRLFQRSIVCFSQQSILKEQDYLSEGETDFDSKDLLSKFEVYQHFANAQTTEDVIQAYNKNNLSYEQIHFAAFQLMNIINYNQISSDSQLDAFIQEKIIPNFDKLTSEQSLTIIQLFLKLQNKSYSIQIKKHIDQNLKNYTYLQLPYVFSFYSKQGWKMVHIGKILKHHLSTQTFNAQSLCQIIRGCYLEYINLKQNNHSDLAFQTSQQLINLIENINFNGLVAIFYQLASMKLDQNSSFKRIPEIIPTLSEKFIQNFDQISSSSKLKLLEAFSELPESFPNDLYLKLCHSFESDNLTNTDQLKLYILLKIQKEKNQPEPEILQIQLNKINFEDILDNNLLIKFLDIEFGEQNQNIISICIKNLKENQNHLSVKQKTDFIKIIIKQNKLDEILDLNQINDNQFQKIIEQLHYCHKNHESFKPIQLQENIKACIESFFDKVINLDYDKKLKISSFIITLDSYNDDPFYEFIDRHIKLDCLPESYFYDFILRLNSKSHYNQEIKKKSEQMLPSFDQLERIINNLNNIEYLNDRLTKEIAKWFLVLIDRSIIDDSFNINFSLNLLFTFILTCPKHSLHNMRGTVLQTIRELIELFSKQVYQSQKNIEINIGLLLKFNEQINQLELRTNLINVICQRLCNQIDSLSDLEKLQLATLITETNIHQFKNLTVINNFLNLAVQVELESYEAILMKSKIYLYQMKNQAKLRQIPDDVSLKLMIDQLKLEITKFDINQTKTHYLDGLMVLLDYDGWRYNNLKYEDDGLKDFIEIYFNNIDHLLTITNMRDGLKNILKTIGQFDTKYQFIRNYDKLFFKMLSKCHNLKPQEMPQISICLDYIEFSKKIKLNNDETIIVLADYIKKQIENLKQVQIVEIVRNLSEQKIYSESLFGALTKQISRKQQYYNNFEIIEILNSFTKLGYFNESLILNILDKLQHEQRFQVNLTAFVQTFWSVLICLQYLKKYLDKSYYYRYEKLITHLMHEVQKFPNITVTIKMPVVFRQFMDIYNLLDFSSHLDLQFNQKQQQLGKQIIENGKKLVNTKFLTNQKFSQQFKNLMQFLDKSQIEYKVNYLLDNQYVDFYIQTRNQIISVDNSLYVTYDMKHYTGFHYFNKWILEGAAKKYQLNQIRINAHEWNQMNDDQRRKVLLI